jgi:anti-sigma regulatory factor (Ser/Thr protein kinase)
VTAPAITGARAVLPGVASSVGRARELVRSCLPPGQAAEYAELCTSELVTNAVTHSASGLPGGTFTVIVEPGPAGVVITVIDDGSASAPVVTSRQGGAEHGRGLLLVAALAAEWGTERLGGGRVTWCRLGGVP